MRLMRSAWPLAGVLLVSLASAEIARGGDQGESAPPAPAASSTATGEELGSSFRLFGKTWCLGAQPQATVCDVALPEPAAAEQPKEEAALDRFLATLRRLFGGSTGEPTSKKSG